ncbi:hypothetical protein COB72_00260 [bacterium]|nr:MAG: hypothetical protein COB72_00260 [bacterium]
MENSSEIAISCCQKVCYIFLTMNQPTDTTQTQIRRRIHRQFGGDGAIVTPKDFLDLMSRDAVDQALTRLVQKGVIDRGCGLYHMPHGWESLSRHTRTK